MNKLLVICGPTATGKTALAAEMAKRFDGELISADSRQVYKGMDLVTGKDRPDVPIWLYDVVNPDEDFSVSHWVSLARVAIADIQKRNKLPIVVGGTGLYIKALLEPFETIDVPPDEHLRNVLKNKTIGELQAMVSRGNMNDSDWNNPRRLIRKIEIEKSTISKRKHTAEFDYLVIGLTAPIPVLYQRIDMRKKERLRQGMEEEIAALRTAYADNLPSMSAIDVDEYDYARRQLTWFKKQKDIHWFDITDQNFDRNVTEYVRQWYT